jgi:hypothetical protein
MTTIKKSTHNHQQSQLDYAVSTKLVNAFREENPPADEIYMAKGSLRHNKVTDSYEAKVITYVFNKKHTNLVSFRLPTTRALHMSDIVFVK